MHNVAYHRIERIAGSVITLRAEGVANQELAQVTSSFGTSLARVIRIDGDLVDLQVFAGARGISTDRLRSALPWRTDEGPVQRGFAWPRV